MVYSGDVRQVEDLIALHALAIKGSSAGGGTPARDVGLAFMVRQMARWERTRARVIG